MNKDKGSGLKQTLGFWDLTSAATGQIIGAGIMSLTGVAIGMTGRSVPFAFILASFMVIIIFMPLIMLNTMGRFNGGFYTIIGTMLSEKMTGVFAILFILQNLSLSMYCLSFADYALPFLPFIPRKILAIGILLLVYALNMFGIDKFSKFQNLIVLTLVLALGTFSVYGFIHLDFASYYEPETFLTAGMMGFFTATAQLTFATSGASFIANLSAEAKNPAKDIPKAIIFSTVGVAVLYALMSTTASGILPVSHVANEPLTHVANEILPKPLYIFFMIGGAWFALLSTLNTQLASCTKPLIQAAKDGWFPEKIGCIHKKYKTPVYLLSFFFLVGLIPIVLNIDISEISKTVTLVSTFNNILIILSFYRMTKIYTKEWKKSPMHIGNVGSSILVVSAIGLSLFQGYLMGKALPKSILIANLLIITAGVIFANIRYSKGNVKLNVSFEPIEIEEK